MLLHRQFITVISKLQDIQDKEGQLFEFIYSNLDT